MFGNFDPQKMLESVETVLQQAHGALQFANEQMLAEGLLTQLQVNEINELWDKVAKHLKDDEPVKAKALTAKIQEKLNAWIEEAQAKKAAENN